MSHKKHKKAPARKRGFKAFLAATSKLLRKDSNHRTRPPKVRTPVPVDKWGERMVWGDRGPRED